MRVTKHVAALVMMSVVLLLGAVQTNAGGELHGNANSGIFHNSSCRYYNCKNCYVVFQSRAEAMKAGYRPCKVCGG